jgi:hypothetical protein
MGGSAIKCLKLMNSQTVDLLVGHEGQVYSIVISPGELPGLPNTGREPAQHAGDGLVQVLRREVGQQHVVRAGGLLVVPGQLNLLHVSLHLPQRTRYGVETHGRRVWMCMHAYERELLMWRDPGNLHTFRHFDIPLNQLIAFLYFPSE